MLTWNNHDTFKRCITSMTPLILDDRVEEVIILDNGSHEISLQKLLRSTEKNYNKIRVIYSSENLGIAKGRKYLYDLCQGEYILSFDSDVVIVNAPQFIEMFLKAINLPDMWLVGGGGGNHIFFPSIFRTDINNLPSPNSPSEVTLVDEVAGWFHGFRSSKLKKNGGPLYMDEDFSPFWGEDSDFCYQIKLLGGKCCILGQGNLGHAWSSCDKKENHGTIEVMWKKMTDKWYPKFGKMFQIDFDSQFYKDNYPEAKDAFDIKERYLLEGMKFGHVINKKFISNLFDVKFNSNTQLVYQGQEYHTRKFIDKFFTYDNVISNNYKVIEDNLSNSDSAYFLFINNKEEGINYLKKELIKVRKSAIIILTTKKLSSEIEDFLSSNFTNYYLAEFLDYYDHMIPFIVTMSQIKDREFKNIIKCTNNLEIVEKIKFEKEKDNNLAIDMIMDFLRYRPHDNYSQKGMMISHKNILNIVNCYAIKNILNICLRLPTEYSYNISPRFCPRLALDKMVNQLEYHDHKNKSLVMYLTKIEDSELVKNNCQKLKESGNCDIIIINIGEEKFWKVEELGFDYYFVMQENNFKLHNYFSLLGIVHLLDYSNVILMDDGFSIDANIEEFFNHAYYHNISFLKTSDNFKINLLSIVCDDLMPFASMTQQIVQASQKIIEENKNKEDKDKKDEINIYKTLEINLQRNFALRFLWSEQRQEEEEEISVEYSKYNDDFDPEDDFPLTFEE